MGQDITISCSNCEYNNSFKLGTGYVYLTIDNLKTFMNQEKWEEIQNIIRKENIFKYDYTHSLYVCETCGKLYNRFYVKVTYGKDKNVYQLNFNCPKCKTKLTRVKEDFPIDRIPCPVCKENKLETAINIFWD
ncbi:hypothetical protein ACFL20_05945 [Spirochaetota bacterium]